MKKIYSTKESIEEAIKRCQEDNHIQQVAYSTYHNCLTQVCFTCDCVRTSISEEEIKGKKQLTNLEEIEK